MYALKNSILLPDGQYLTEVYRMELLSYDAYVNINLSIFGEAPYESYAANYEIVRLSDEKTVNGVCNGINKKKEETLEAVEKIAMKAMEDKNRHWR